MNEYNAVLVIESTQWQEDGAPETTRLTTEGRVIRMEDAWILVYEESDRTGLAGTLTTLRAADDGGIALVRTGETEMHMNFREGQHHVTSMSTPYGVVNVSLLTHRAVSSLNEQGGEMHLSYAVDFGSHHSVHTRMNIQVRTAGPA